MNRAIARLLLIFLLVSTIAPVALAISAEPIHACCMRGAHHCGASGGAEHEFTDQATCCDHNCCRPLVRSGHADLALQPWNNVISSSPTHRGSAVTELASSGAYRFHLGRAPPFFFFA